MRSFFTLPALLGVLLLPTAQAELTATLSSGDKSDQRIDRLPALRVEQGEAPSAFLEPGPFTVIWTGTLNLPARYRLNFSFAGRGKAVLKVDGEEILREEGELGTAVSDRLRLNAGETPIEIAYTSAEDGSGHFRLYWEERSFPRESIPPTVFTTDAPPTLRTGRHLFAEHSCVKCHSPGQPFGEGAMPELSHDAPDLTSIGSRVSEEWLRQWIAQPHTLKPTTTMPAMVNASTEEGKQQAADLAAWLASLGAPAEQAVAAFPDELIKRGGQIFHELGCVACHTLPDADAPDLETGRVPLHNTAAKFLPGQVELFLKNPRAHYQTIGMPDFRLNDEEAGALAAYLTSASTGKATVPVELPATGDAARGKDLAKAMNCAACHVGPEPAATPTALPLASLPGLSGGCLAGPEGHGNAPLPNLDEEDRAAIAAFLAGPDALPSLRRDTPAEFAERQFHSLRCFACHSRDHTPSLLASVHGESKPLVAHIEGHDEKLDQSRPQLTYIGEMLNTTYIEDMLDGTVEPEPRPWLEMRMPAFHHHAASLAKGLSLTHGIAPGGPDDTARDPELAKTGQMIAGQTGLACVLCHGVNDMKPLAAFEVQGIDFNQTHQRLRPEYFYRWMHNPSRVIAETKMPRYTMEDGSSLRPDILGGDAQKQFEALWHYILAGPQMEKP